MTVEFTNCNIINIGDEILSGHTINTNASFISSALYDIGLYTRRISVISDDASEIVSELEKGMKDAELIFITGGLGPTSDDITKRTLCSFFGFDLEFRQDIWEHILELFAKRGIIPDEVNKEQAQFPTSVQVKYLRNSAGTAPGMHIETGGRHIFIMPGVPNEMRTMMTDSILPFLKKEFSGDLYYRDINTSDIPESSLYSILSAEKDYPFGCRIAYLPQGYGVTVRIKTTGGESGRQFVDDAAERISVLAKDHIFAYGIVSPAHELVRLLKEKKMTLSSAESCTGGLFASSVTDVPGSSAVFSEGYITYSNTSKFRILSVNPQTLAMNGAVSEETVSEMLDGMLAVTSSDFVCAVSGIAGPDGGTAAKPVGTVYAGFCSRTGNEKFIRKYNFSGDRTTVKRKAADKLAVELIKFIGRS
ncbi:MAG TPA: CinA family nicotinamide mononucleotide deamidase-related protein [Clostridiales bacterium]|nr:CinA family nicotinamide mononucleotide deamidase-related protein [Clostridiales bacterium]